MTENKTYDAETVGTASAPPDYKLYVFQDTLGDNVTEIFIKKGYY